MKLCHVIMFSLLSIFIPTLAHAEIEAVYVYRGGWQRIYPAIPGWSQDEMIKNEEEHKRKRNKGEKIVFTLNKETLNSAFSELSVEEKLKPLKAHLAFVVSNDILPIQIKVKEEATQGQIKYIQYKPDYVSFSFDLSDIDVDQSIFSKTFIPTTLARVKDTNRYQADFNVYLKNPYSELEFLQTENK